MTEYYVDSEATGTPDGLTRATAWLHPDDITPAGLIAGDIVNIYNGPYYQPAEFLGKGSGGAGNPVIWRGHGFPEWHTGLDLNSVSGGEWHESASGTNEYYFTGASGADPSLTAVTSCATVNGHYFETSAEEATYQRGDAALGSMFDGQLGFGDNDTLGFDTVYVRLDNLTHSTASIIVAQQTSVFSTNFTNQKFENIIFSYGEEGVEARSGTGKWEFHRCIFKYCDYQAVNAAQDNNVDVVSCLGFFAGHRFATKGSAGDAGQLLLYNNISIKSHLFALISRWTIPNTILRNNIGYLLSAGVLDTEADGGGAGTIDEDYNTWYPDWTGGATDMNYPASAGTRWATTGANSYPPSAATTIDNIADNLTAGAIEPTFNIDFSDLDVITNAQLISLVLAADSGLLGQGTKWWTGANPTGLNGEPYGDFDTDPSANQSKHNPFHPVNL